MQLPFNAAGWIALSIGFGAACFQVVRSRRIIYSPLVLKLAACCGLLLIPLLYNESDLRTVGDRFLGIGAGLLLLLSLLQFNFGQGARLGLLTLAVGGVIVEALIGWSQVYANINGLDLTPYNNYVPAGVFQQINNMASYLATGVVLSAYVVALLGRGDSQQPRWWILTPLLLMPLLAIHLMNLLASRAAILGITVGLCLVLPLMLRQARLRYWGAWILMLALGGGVSYVLEQVEDPQLQGPEKPILTFTSFRQVHFPQSFQMFLDRPLQGYGYGRFEGEYVRHTADAYAQGRRSQPPIAGIEHPENELLLWAVEGGVVALSGVLLAAFFVFQAVLRQPLLHRLALIGIFFPLVIHSQLEFPFYTSVAHWAIFIILIYLVTGLSEPTREMRCKPLLAVAVCGVMIPVVTTAFMVSTLQSGALLARYEFGIDEDVGQLQNMKNPVVWYDRMLLAIYFRLVLNGIASKNPSLAEPFVEWGPSFIEKYPRPHHIQYLILAYQVKGDISSATELQARARHYFPAENFEMLDISRLEPAELDELEVGRPRQ